jgi:hypothetical protein
MCGVMHPKHVSRNGANINTGKCKLQWLTFWQTLHSLQVHRKFIRLDCESIFFFDFVMFQLDDQPIFFGFKSQLLLVRELFINK